MVGSHAGTLAVSTQWKIQHKRSSCFLDAANCLVPCCFPLFRIQFFILHMVESRGFSGRLNRLNCQNVSSRSAFGFDLG